MRRFATRCRGLGRAPWNESEATFERWEANANRYREQVAAEIGEQARSDFVRACNVLSKLWSEEVLGYGLLAAVKGR